MSQAHPERQVADGAGEPPVVRDKRRVDPDTGLVREPAAAQPGPAPTGEPAAGAGGVPDAAPADQAVDDLVADQAESAESVVPQRDLAAEHLADLQRVQAEYVNYRRRVERDRDVARGAAVAGVLEALMPVLDDVHLAREHGDLEGGPFAAVADKLEAVLARFGLVRYGEVGEAFDPAVHEALMHTQAELAEGTEVTTVVQVLQPGYRAGDRVLRAARVAVADPH